MDYILLSGKVDVSLAIGIASWFHNHGITCFYIALLLIILTMIQW